MEFTLWYDGLPLSDHSHLLARPTEGGLSSLVDRHGHVFAAVVSRSLGLRAELDILMLRPSSPGDLVNKGDIDNRLKTLLDALSAPAQPTQVPDGMRATSDGARTPEDYFDEAVW